MRRVLKSVVERGKAKWKEEVASKKATALVPKETQHQRDLRMLQNRWEASCDGAREEFLRMLPTLVALKQRIIELEAELKELRFSCKCGVAKPRDLTPAAAGLTIGDDLGIPEFLRVT